MMRSAALALFLAACAAETDDTANAVANSDANAQEDQQANSASEPRVISPPEYGAEPDANRSVMVTPESCNAEEYQSFIGFGVDAISLPEGTTHRVVGQNARQRGNNNPGRLNIFVDEDRVVIAVNCG